MPPISVLDMFKVGVGPSSSHTLGPWKAALDLLGLLGDECNKIRQVQIHLYGSLAKTGKGHGTDFAVMLGLSGFDPETFEVADLHSTMSGISAKKQLNLAGENAIPFDPELHIHFLKEVGLPYHPNALKIICQFSDDTFVEEVYYSTGGGFIVREGEDAGRNSELDVDLPFPINSAAELSTWCEEAGLSISGVVARNELAWRSEDETRRAVLGIWNVMSSCIYRGCHTDGILPGGLLVTRRAPAMNRRLLGEATYAGYDDWMRAVRDSGEGFAYTLDWVTCFALAVNEENASFGRVVTAPTNGAAGVIPSVLQYLIAFNDGRGEDLIFKFLCTASEIGSIFKKRATISAAMGGCQAEIGVSSAMAAAGLTECMGGSAEQCLMAAEIAMEHHLGMTCDPIGGLVQVPCIERNSMGAIKAITASHLALHSDPSNARVSLDAVVNTMWDTARDMSSKYKETSDGGLAVNIPISLSEC